MKKSLFSLSILCLCFVTIACNNPVETPTDNGITANQLIEKMPVSLDEFEKQASSARTATTTTVNPEDLNDIKESQYNHYFNDGEFSYGALFLTVLKNDVIKAKTLEYNQNIDISSVVPDSQATDAYLKTFTNVSYSYRDLFSNLGTVKVSYENNKVELYWSLTVIIGDGSGQTVNMILYITGTFADNKYADFTTAVNIAGDNGSINFEAYKIQGNKSILENTLYRSNGSCRTILMEKDGSSFVIYNVGEDRSNDNISAADLEKYAKWRWIRFKNSECAASFMNDHNYSYNIYDSKGALLFKQLFYNNDDNNLTQIIPLKYIRSSHTIQKDDDGNYSFTDDSTSNIKIQEIEFIMSDNTRKKFPCVMLESNTATQIPLPENYTFVKKDLTLQTISKLDEYYAKSNSQAFLNSLTPKESFGALQAKIDAWSKTI